MEFVNDFKHIVVFIAAIIFLLITVFITIRQVKKLPLSYSIQILDNHGERIILTDLRLHFRKLEVAESSLLPRHVWTRTVQIQGDWSKKVAGNGSPERNAV